MTSVIGDSFGLKRPPLCKLIKDILEEYPSGQIFKEIIQNADDARATDVKFFLDFRTFKALPPELISTTTDQEEIVQQFSGPALLSYNNAPFKEEDWANIQRLQQSGKAKNPHKVGKFGIGFNSVYHITDLPVILSQNYCGFIEPQEIAWKGETGNGFTLEELKDKFPAVLEPFDGICGFSKQNPSFKNMTLFRFPLRNKKSKLSNKSYTIEELRSLLDALKKEAQYLLVFLRSVCSIEICQITKSNTTELLFKVSLSERDYQSRISPEKSLIKKVESTFKGQSQYSSCEVIKDVSRFKIEIVDNCNVTEHEWLVVNQIGSSDAEVKQLAEKQHVLPWVGTAVSLNDNDLHSVGRIFCALPLPIEDQSPFFVHVNGTFAICNNRRSLKWEAQERKGDEESTWNKLLVERCLFLCYFELVCKLMEQHDVSTSMVYKCWPDIKKTQDTPWYGLLAPFYQLLVKSSKAVHTWLSGGEWISIKEAIFVNDKLPVAVRNALMECSIKLVDIDDSCSQALKQYYLDSLTMIQPALVKFYLKHNLHSYCNGSKEDKFEILKYCLSDKTYNDLTGLQLLPLANGNFQQFYTKLLCEEAIFLSSSSYPSDLLPDLESKLVSVYNEDEQLHLKLSLVSYSGCTQLTMLNTKEIANLISLGITSKWSSKQMSHFWHWLQKQDLLHFQSKFLVQIKSFSNGTTGIAKLAKEDGVVYISQIRNTSMPLSTGLEKCGIKFADAHAFPHLLHKDLDKYLYQFDPNQILDAMQSLNVASDKLNSHEAIALQKYFSNSDLGRKKRINTVCKIPMFKVLQQKIRVSVDFIKSHNSKSEAIAMDQAYSCETNLLPNTVLVIDATENESNLIKSLHGQICLLREAEFLQNIAFDQIHNGEFPINNVVPFMTSVLKNFDNQEYKKAAEQLTSAMRRLPFVEVVNSLRLEAPQNLFDPDKKILIQLYLGENKFPSSCFHPYLSILRQCSLKIKVNANDINLILRSIRTKTVHSHTSYETSDNNYKRAIAILKYLSQHCHLLNDIDEYNSMLTFLRKEARQYYWLPVSSNRPTNYPLCLAWKGSEYSNSLVSCDANSLIVLTQNLSSSKLPMIAGSQVLFIDNVPIELEDLGSQSSDMVPAIISHFNQVISNEDKISGDILELISCYTYEYLFKNIKYCNAQSFSGKWIWLQNLSTFICSNKVAIAAHPSFRLNLEPFIYLLPSNLLKFFDLFKKCGVPTEVTPSQIVSVLHSIKNTSNQSKLNEDEAWSIVIAILSWVAENINSKSNILVPVDDDSVYPQLFPFEEVTYTDNDMLHAIAKDSDEKYRLIHPKLFHLSSKLGLTPLSDHLDITEDVFDDAGQNEPLTTRLSNILKDYKDGLTIIKEMMQNADDAEATQVNILYDNRTHSTEKLLFKGMASSHGPALIVHNDSTFKNEDFENITKLAGATKKNQPLKIGKFGVGFCSVYHITDVPSFVSGEWFYIFDPTLKYLKGVVRNESRPGKKVKYQSKFMAQSQQMAPYEKIFQFTSSANYDGTIFRLPFRENASQISSTIYNEHLVQKLKNDLKENGSKLLIFLQNVKRITFSSLDGDKQVIDISITCSNEGNGIKKCTTICSNESEIEYWLVANQKGILKQDDDDKPGIASVACQLIKQDLCYKSQVIKGNLFCFLPLSSSSTGLPVHVNANFAVLNNRSGILIEETHSNLRGSWNMQLMKTIIPEAYCNLLKKLQEMSASRQLLSYEENFYLLWPLTEKLQVKNLWTCLISALMKLISDKPLFYSSSTGQWLTLAQSRFLYILFGSKLIDFYKAASILKLPVVSLPKDYFDQLIDSSCVCMQITDSVFLQKFFSKIDLFRSDSSIEIRNSILSIILSAIGSDHKQYSKIVEQLRTIPCIPTSPVGKELKPAHELVDPFHFQAMFDPEDGMFPLNCLCENPLTYKAMQTYLNLMTETISWDAIIKSAKTIKQLFDSNKRKALERVKLIIKSIGTQARNECPVDTFKSIPFLPVLQKPDVYILPWKGCGSTVMTPSEIFAATSVSNLQRISFIAGTQKAIANTMSLAKDGCTSIPKTVLELLEISSEPTIEDVLNHFNLLIELMMSDVDRKNCLQDEAILKHVNDICQMVYAFFEDHLENNVMVKEIEEKLHFYDNKPFIWTGKEFVTAANVSRNWKKEDGPYLHKLPNILAMKRQLQQVLSIKDEFDINKLLDTLVLMHCRYKGVPLPPDNHEFIDILISEVNTAKGNYEGREQIILVDQNYILRPSSELYYNDAEWLQVEVDKYHFLHKHMLSSAADSLGVKRIRISFLDNFVNEKAFQGSKFGQREDLTQRIRNILRDYPLNESFLKELLQNADDAKARKVCVILDKRQHGSQTTLSKEWSNDLQGPAILVWNDNEFTKKDLEGIQKLGLGSKRDDDQSIGQFGIGFNVVYHVTDCPSFITCNSNVLCVFDPHCKYVLGADESHPGRQYDDLNNGFWEKMEDLRSCYLQDPIPGQPEHFKTGTLFRFPLRWNEKLVKQSLVIESKETHSVLVMEVQLEQWVGKIEEALLFLNHITQFEYYVIESTNSVFKLESKYEVTMSSTAMQCHKKYQKYLSEQSKAKSTSQSCNPKVFSYSLTLKTERKRKKSYQKWVIQQGIGDTLLVDQKWLFIGKVLPKHGLAVPLKSLKGFVGKIFCFLPLPITSNLPLHINGQFVLTSDRRSLWHGENKHSDKNQWNNQLIKAIASSYTSFLTELRQYVVDTEGFMNDRDFYRAVDSYYDLFPYWKMPKQSSFSTAIRHSSIDATAMSHTPSGTTTMNRVSLDDPWLALAKDVFSKLWTQNCEILVSKVYDGNKIKTNWHKLHNDDIDAFTQAYFPQSRPVLQPNRVLPILKRLGMTLTCASETLYKNFKEFEPFIATSEQTFNFYCKFHSRIVSCPTLINCSPFKCEKDFAIFLKYIMKSPKDNSQFLQFMKPPYKLPLLLTADSYIRYFDESNKVLCSRFYYLFSESLSAFLHPCLLELEMLPTYFLNTDNFTFSQVKELLDKNLPSELSLNEVINKFNKVIDKTKLKDIWSCISKDENFLQHQKHIVKCWALLPSTSNSLYQSKSLIIPILKSRHNKPLENELKLYELLCDSLSIPLLDEAIHESAAKYCPLLSKYDKVFQVIYNQQCQHSVFEKAELQENDIEVLLSYFSRTSFRNDEAIRNNIKSIPIFMTVNKVLTSLLGKNVYLWPKDGCCVAGYEKWAVLDSVVFLEYEGSWRNLCGNDFSLLGETPDEREIYCQLIFPCFTELTDEERKQHLQHIKDKLIDNSIFEAEKMNFDLAAIKFINKLKILKCLSHNGIMLNISSFCDPTVKIFTTFSEHFYFLEGDYCHETWLKFFRKLGLQTTVDFDTFIKLAKQVEKGDHSELESASDILFSYIFSIDAEPWYKSKYNMSMIGNIRFVKTAKLKRFSWIKVPCSPPHWFQSQSIGLTKCKEAVVDRHAAVIWTVKPVITLHKTPSSKMNNVLSQLEVILEPDPADVYQNIINISNTSLANPELFSKYSPLLECRDNEDKISIFEIIIANIEYLYVKNSKLLENLREVSCIPVLADGTDKSKTVLVRPLQVLVQAVNDFVPYLHTVPESLYPIMQAFQIMGVSRELELKHINYMLRLIKDFHPDSIMISDPNELSRITKAIRKIYELLLRNDKEKSQEQLVSLHLPTQVSQSHFKLVPSKCLVFKDSTRYKLEKLIFSKSSYFLFKIPLRDSKLSEKEFCLKLPRSVRPHGFSLCCHETVLCAQQNKDSGSPLVSHFEKFRKLFPKIACSISSIIDKNLPHMKDSEKFCEKLKEILTEMTVTTINNLQVKVALKDDSDCIGVLKVDYSLQKTNETYTLFVDEKTTSSSTLWVEMAQSLCIEISRLLKCDLLKFFKCKESLSLILAVQSINDMQQLVDVQDLDVVDDDEVSNDYKPNIGRPLPNSLVTMLSQNIDYIFRPQDLVGYELEVNYYIWAMILYPVVDDTESAKNDTGPKLKRYVIAWSELEEPITVSSVYLHRFAPQEFTEQSTETALATYHGVSELEELKDSKELFEMKQKIVKDLKLIWNSDLSDKEKKKAVLRMFLSYHPDKAMNNKHLYEEAFKFLQRQLDRLEKGLQLEEQKDDGPVDNCEPSQWREYFTSCSDVFKTYNHKSRTGGIGGNKGRKGGVGKFDSWSDYVEPKPDVIEAKRWLRQANSDREAMEILLDSLSAKRVSCQVAFLAHEVVEKALKAGMYQLIGINPSCESLVHHKLTSHARAISSEKPGQAKELPGIASKMESSYLDTRFPNRHPMPSAPVDVYCPEQARRNAEMAETVYKIIFKIVNN